MPLSDEDERYVQFIEKRIADAGLENVGVVRGTRYPMGAGDAAVADEIQRRINERADHDSAYPITVVGAEGTAQRESVVDAEGQAVTGMPMMADRQLDPKSEEDHYGVAETGQHFTEEQLAALRPLREAYAKGEPLRSDRRIAQDESVGEGHPPGVVMAEPVAVTPPGGSTAPIVHSDQVATPDQLQANVDAGNTRARRSRQES